MSNADCGLYDKVERWCKESVTENQPFLFDPELFRKMLEHKSEEFGFPYESLHSLLRNIHLHAVKISTPKVKRNLSKYLELYKEGKSIKSLSRSADFPPFLMARQIVSEIVVGVCRKNITKMMRNPKLIKKDTISKEFHQAEDAAHVGDRVALLETRLAVEVEEAVHSDPMYGPEHDKHRHFIGVEYEVALERQLASMGIPFETESQLREKGSARTPDVLLTCPIAVEVDGEWRVVCWIDSKALFGDTTTHEHSVLPQCESYVHRFGPGLILYWFGHAPLARLGDAKGDIVIMGWQLPQSFIWPTGERHFPDPNRKMN